MLRHLCCCCCFWSVCPSETSCWCGFIIMHSLSSTPVRDLLILVTTASQIPASCSFVWRPAVQGKLIKRRAQAGTLIIELLWLQCSLTEVSGKLQGVESVNNSIRLNNIWHAVGQQHDHSRDCERWEDGERHTKGREGWSEETLVSERVGGGSKNQTWSGDKNR